MLNKYKLLYGFFSLLLGLVYFFMIQVNITDIKHINKNAKEFSFIVDSNINQEVKLHIGAGRYKLRVVESSGIVVSFPDKKRQWFEGIGEQVVFLLKEGKNNFIVQVDNYKRGFVPQVKQKLSSFNYMVLFFLLGIPTFHLIFTMFLFFIDKIKYKPLKIQNSQEQGYINSSYLLFSILAIGIVIRIIYFHKYGVMLFQHDWHGHIEFIKLLANDFTLPLASKGLEYPQQPLYYLITGSLFSFFTWIGLEESKVLFALGYVSLLSSMAFIYYSYRFVALMTKERWIHIVAMVFISLTPSLVYMSARINNDSLVMALSAISLYYVVKSYQLGFKTGFYKALISVSLLFMTKISAAPMELLLFSLLLISYMQTSKENKVEKDGVKRSLYTFGLVGVFLLGFTFLRVYLPIEESFHMVNSSANYPRQTIEDLGSSYFATFNITALLQTGYSYVYGLDDIRYSFLTYQYGTMFFGEFNYNYYIERKEFINEIMQGVLFFGLIYIVGLLLYVFQLHKRGLLEVLLFLLLVFNLVLILKFMLSYPAICNTDFRYFVPSFALFSFFFAKGLFSLQKYKYLSSGINVTIGLLAFFQISFFIRMFI